MLTLSKIYDVKTIHPHVVLSVEKLKTCKGYLVFSTASDNRACKNKTNNIAEMNVPGLATSYKKILFMSPAVLLLLYSRCVAQRIRTLRYAVLRYVPNWYVKSFTTTLESFFEEYDRLWRQYERSRFHPIHVAGALLQGPAQHAATAYLFCRTIKWTKQL